MSVSGKKINIDFLLAGCNTRCRHCYVAGGPGPMMPLGDALLCLERLDVLASYLPCEVSFTLDHEPMNHPGIKRILRAAAGTEYIRNYHHGMTTGLGLMQRKDRDDVLQAYMDCGYDSFGVTIHGNAAHHDGIVRRGGAYAGTVSAAEYLKAFGASLEISLMVNRFFPGDAESITALIDRLQPDPVICVLPIFTPHRHMMDFEPYRATLPDIDSLKEYLPLWKQDALKLLNGAHGLTVAAAVSRLRNAPGLLPLFEAPQDELYLTLHQDCLLFVGNSGAETKLIGDIRWIDPGAAAETIMRLPGNRDYGAFYEISELPGTDALIRSLEKLPQDLVFGDFESAVYRGLSSIGIRTKLL